VISTPNDDESVTAAGAGPACATPPDPVMTSTAPTIIANRRSPNPQSRRSMPTARLIVIPL
jgi:hypothetical protein